MLAISVYVQTMMKGNRMDNLTKSNLKTYLNCLKICTTRYFDDGLMACTERTSGGGVCFENFQCLEKNSLFCHIVDKVCSCNDPK